MNNIEIIGITTCGTYPAWTDYTIASFYNHVDKIIVINSGYDINDPEKGLIRLERDHNLIKDIDINNKVIEITPSQETIDNLFKISCRYGKDEIGRTTNITIATLTAYNLPNPKNKQRYILKLDNDQILYQIKKKQLIDLIDQYYYKTGFRFAQYADYYHDFKHISDGLPDEFTNDGALFYRSFDNQRYVGQGSPDIHADQQPVYTIRTSHMRRINPPGVEPYEYHYKRLWYHTYGPNSIMEHGYNRETGKRLTDEQIKDIAHKGAIAILQNKGRDINMLQYDDRIPYKPPLVCEMTPLEYIELTKDIEKGF